MKKVKLFTVVCGIAMVLSACGTKKTVAQNTNKGGGNPFGESYSAPCEVYDTPQDFEETGISKGSK